MRTTKLHYASTNRSGTAAVLTACKRSVSNAKRLIVGAAQAAQTRLTWADENVCNGCADMLNSAGLRLEAVHAEALALQLDLDEQAAYRIAWGAELAQDHAHDAAIAEDSEQRVSLATDGYCPDCDRLDSAHDTPCYCGATPEHEQVAMLRAQSSAKTVAEHDVVTAALAKLRAHPAWPERTSPFASLKVEHPSKLGGDGARLLWCLAQPGEYPQYGVIPFADFPAAIVAQVAMQTAWQLAGIPVSIVDALRG